MSKVELTRKWWNANRPKDVKGLELDRALASLEQAKGPARLNCLATIPVAVAKVRKELDKKEDKDLLKALDTLEAFAQEEEKSIQAEAAAAEKAKAKSEAEKKEAKEGNEDEEEAPVDKIFEPAFQLGVLKRAIRAPLIFAFAIGAKPEQSILAVHVRGNPKALLRLAKTKSGAMKGCCGQAQAAEEDPKTLTLSLDGPPVSGLARMMRKYFQANKITVFRKFRVLVDGEEVESDTNEEETVTEASSGASSAAPKASVPEQPSTPPTEKEMAVLEDRRRDFKKVRAAWVAVKTKAEMDLEKVKDGARMEYMADSKQFPKIMQGCKEIDDILDNLDDELRDTLDQYASTSLKNQNKLHGLAATATEILDRYRSYVESNAVMKAIDLKEFADVTIHAPIMKALADLRRALT